MIKAYHERMFCVGHTFCKDKNEDAYGFVKIANQITLCVADGCGGLGSRRYPQREGQTGAYIAANTVKKAVLLWGKRLINSMPQSAKEGAHMRDALSHHIDATLLYFVQKHPWIQNPTRMKGSLQQMLPTTLCVARLQLREKDTQLCFLWEGDSRGYTLTETGLHQYTQDDVKGQMDAFDCLYQSTVLSKFITSASPTTLQMRCTSIQVPCIVFVATDGVHSCHASPMAFEFWLLQTMKEANSEATWRQRMQSSLHAISQDDASLVCMTFGFENYQAMVSYYHQRYLFLNSSMNRPNVLVTQQWKKYKEQYDHTEGDAYAFNDWRL